MVRADATRIGQEIVNRGEIGRNLLSSVDMASASADEIHSEARGSHWIAWVTRAGDPKPHRSVVLVGRTQDEALARARRWAEAEP